MIPAPAPDWKITLLARTSRSRGGTWAMRQRAIRWRLTRENGQLCSENAKLLAGLERALGVLNRLEIQGTLSNKQDQATYLHLCFLHSKIVKANRERLAAQGSK